MHSNNTLCNEGKSKWNFKTSKELLLLTETYHQIPWRLRENHANDDVLIVLSNNSTFNFDPYTITTENVNGQ